MSNYIHHTNQTLLWNTVNKIPEFQKLSPPKKDFEFKKVIEFFYRTVSNKQILSLYELQKINRDTILAFIPSQQPIQSQPTQQPTPMDFTRDPSSFTRDPSGFTRDQGREPRIPTQNQFEERQNIYKQMTTKPDLPSPEIFKDKEDTAIENMDVLINQYQKQREFEFKQFIPPTPVLIPPPPPHPQIITKKNPHIRILEEISEKEKEKIGILMEDEGKNEKKVSFSSNNQEYITEDDYWEKKMSKLEERIFLLEEKLLENEIKQEISLSLEKIINQIE
jgi:hypothetical protein